MTTSTLQVFCDVRPARIAFVVARADEQELRNIFQLNATLWGGIYNPIVVLDGSGQARVGDHETFGRTTHEDEILWMLKEFDPDVLIAYSDLAALPQYLKPFEHRMFKRLELRWNPMGDREVSFYLEIWPFA
ncbi:MAG: hypothetical protein ACREMY_10035, partial [bacterium]